MGSVYRPVVTFNREVTATATHHKAKAHEPHPAVLNWDYFQFSNVEITELKGIKKHLMVYYYMPSVAPSVGVW